MTIYSALRQVKLGFVSPRGSLAVSESVMKVPGRSSISFVLLSVLLTAPAAFASTNALPAPVRTLESLVSEWIKLRSEIAAEERELAERELQWNEEIRLLETEKVELEKELADADAVLTSAQQERAGLLEDNRGMQEALAALEPILDRAEAELRRWEKRVPPSLCKDLLPLFAKLPPAQSGGEKGDVAQRLQAVIALYTQIESLQHGIHVTREMLPTTAASRRELDVLYIGLAAGFGVSPDNQAAVVGKLSEEGWTWESRNDLAQKVRRALNIFNREAV